MKVFRELDGACKIIAIPRSNDGRVSPVKIARFLAFAFVVVSAALVPIGTKAQVTSNVFQRVLKVRVNAGTDREGFATAFTVDVEGREYLVTAKHVVAGLKDKDRIDVFMNGGWKRFDVQIFRCDDPVDIAVLIPPYQLTVNFSLPFDMRNFMFGQVAYFLGFPFEYGIEPTLPKANGPYPLPFVKAATISGMMNFGEEKKVSEVLLDGCNNPGFSGGPIVYKDLNQSGTVIRLAGVVSGFRPEVVPVVRPRNIDSPADAGPVAKGQPWRIQKKRDGTFFEYVDSGTYVSLNTGIVIGYLIEPAIELIRKHPVGPEAKDLPNNTPREDQADGVHP
jgi:hypothetical protein